MDELEFVSMSEEIWLRAENILADLYNLVSYDEDGDSVPFHFHTYGHLAIEQIERLIDLFNEMQELEEKANRKPGSRLATFRDFLHLLKMKKK